jgi:signal transduction histidine kinase
MTCARATRPVAMLCLAACAATGPVYAQAPARRAVVTIHQGAGSFPSNPVYDRGIRAGLLANVHGPIEYFAEYLNPESATPLGEDDAFADYFRKKYRGRHIDVVITVADDATRFAVRYRRDLFPDAAIVFGGLFEPDEALRTSGGGMTGVRVGAAYGKTIEAALALQPDTTRVFVIANSPSPSITAMARQELNDFASRVPLTYLEAPTIAQLLDQVRALPQHSIVVYLWHPGSELGNLVYSDTIAGQVAQASPVPVYGTSDLYLGLGVVGGVVRRTDETGTRMGELAAAILNGAHAPDLPIETSPLVPMFDWRQLQRWNIAASVLPAGSDVRFKTPTLWEAYRGYLIAAVIVMSAELALIAGLLTQRARRRRAEATIRAREATLRRTYEQTRNLAGRLLNAQEATRAAIARDLHDGLCQDLASVTAAVGGLRNSGAMKDPHAQHALAEIEEEALGVYDQIRRLSHDLHPPTLRLLGLPSALKALCAEVGKRQGIDVAFSTDGAVGRLDPDMEIALFRITQEAVRNSIVHGHAHRVTVALGRLDGHVELTIADDGRGFDVEAARQRASGLGLLSMDERAHVFGGDVHIESAQERGTTIRVHGTLGAPTEIV